MSDLYAIYTWSPYSGPKSFIKDDYNCFGFDRNGIHKVIKERLNEHGNTLGVRHSDIFDAYTNKYHNQNQIGLYNSMSAVDI